MYCADLGESVHMSIYYLLAKFGFDTAENEPCKVYPLSAYRYPRYVVHYTQGTQEKEGSFTFSYVLEKGPDGKWRSFLDQLSAGSDFKEK